MPLKRGLQTGKVRIIGGDWRGRKLTVHATEGLRPTGDRVRETLFNWLQGEVYGTRCLDLFAGTGALGFEALSRGARHVSFVELHKQAALQLQSNIQTLNAHAQMFNCRAEDFLLNYRGETFDIVFIDPPFAASLWEPTFTVLERANCLAQNGLIYVESPTGSNLILPSTWEIQKSKTSGAVRYELFRSRAISP